jgi:small subunit ribosomal protein S6
MRVYELVFIVKPDLPEEEVDAALALVRETLEGGGATVDKEDKWGKRRLAYRVQRYEDGYFVLVQYSMDDQAADAKAKAGLPKEVERRLRVADAVIKFMTVRIDEDMKRMEKAKAKRDGRTTRRPSGGGPGRSGGGGSSPAPDSPGLPDDGDSGDDDDNKNEKKEEKG